MVEWTLVLITMPIFAGTAGHVTAVPMVDQKSCLQTAISTFQEDLKAGNAFTQGVCMTESDAERFIVTMSCHDPDKHHNPDRLDMSCEGIGASENVPSVVLPPPEPKRK